MRLHTSLVGAAAIAALLPIGRTNAQLASVGPVDPANGFPTSYTDTNGLSLDLCLTDPLLCLLDAPVTLSNPNQAFPQNYGGTFPEEAFWQRVDGIMPTSNGGQALLVMALEAAFVNGPVAAGDQVTFARVRVRVDNLVAGANYTVTTPVGIFNFVAANAGPRGINSTVDIGLIPGVFTTALGGAVGPWLQWDSGLPVLDAAGREYIGNPGIEHTITGGDGGINFFRIQGPSVGGPGVNSIQTNTFVVMGLKSRAVAAGPVANFSSAPNSGNSPLLVSFTNASTGTITSRLWNFGDGQTSTATNPTHSYAAGTFSVSLTVNGPGGTNTLNKPNLIVVGNPNPGNGLVLASPNPGRAAVQNSYVVTGATPGRTVGVFTGLTLGGSIVNQGSCGGIPIGISTPNRLVGKAVANASGIATILGTPPAGSAGKMFHFQAVEPSSCRVSNVISDVQ
jgi:PKD repeat protein